MEPVGSTQRWKHLNGLTHAVRVADLKMEVLGMSHRARAFRTAQWKGTRFGGVVFHAVDRHTHQCPTAIAELHADTRSAYQEQQNKNDGAQSLHAANLLIVLLCTKHSKPFLYKNT
jgi:hypothetical protein